jgi:hypothetical protein
MSASPRCERFDLDRFLGVPPSTRERREWLWRMTVKQRVAAMYAGELSLADCLAWAARFPDEPPTISGEWAFIAIRTPEVAEADDGCP